MKNKTIFLFIKKLFVLLIPFFLLFIYYVYKDPFKVIKTYKTYSNIPVYLNRSYIGWQTYLNNKDSLHYDSFILGNSCAMAYPTDVWKKYLNKDASPICLYGNGESIYAIWKKVKRLDELGANMKNLLLVIDRSTFRRTSPNYSFMNILHNDISGQKSTAFQIIFAAAFIRVDICLPIIDYSIFKKRRSYMTGIIGRDDKRDNITNDIVNPREEEIKLQSENYWELHKKEFPERSAEEKVALRIIEKNQLDLIKKIMNIFKKHHTDFHIVISPNWSREKVNPDDLSILYDVFGKERIHNFTGINQFTENKHYFYEKGHYRPMLGKKILDSVYGSLTDTSKVSLYEF